MPFKVCSGQCDQCLFSENRIVSKNRKNQIIQDCLATNSHFICHKGSLVGEDICCHGFYQSYGSQINLIRVARRLNAVEMVDVDELSKKSKKQTQS